MFFLSSILYNYHTGITNTYAQWYTMLNNYGRWLMKINHEIFSINIAVLLFGMAGLFAKAVALPALIITLGRVLFSSITLLIVAYFFKISLKLKKRQHLFYFIGAGIILALHWWSFLYAIQLSSVAIGTITFSTFPLFVTILSALLFKERLLTKQIMMCLLIIIGVILTIPSLSLANQDFQGVITGLFSALTYALLTLINKYFSSRYPSVTISFYEQLSSSVILLPSLLLQPVIFQGRDIAMIMFLGIICTALAHTLFISSLKGISGYIAGMISSLESVYSIIFAMILFQEIPTFKEATGALIIIATVMISQLPQTGGTKNGT